MGEGFLLFTSGNNCGVDTLHGACSPVIRSIVLHSGALVYSEALKFCCFGLRAESLFCSFDICELQQDGQSMDIWQVDFFFFLFLFYCRTGQLECYQYVSPHSSYFAVLEFGFESEVISNYFAVDFFFVIESWLIRAHVSYIHVPALYLNKLLKWIKMFCLSSSELQSCSWPHLNQWFPPQLCFAITPDLCCSKKLSTWIKSPKESFPL